VGAHRKIEQKRIDTSMVFGEDLDEESFHVQIESQRQSSEYQAANEKKSGLLAQTAS
jgi:hypothetical protein